MKIIIFLLKIQSCMRVNLNQSIEVCRITKFDKYKAIS